MDWLFIVTGIIVAGSIFMYGAKASQKQQSVSVMTGGEKVRRAAHQPTITYNIDDVRTLYESWTLAVKKFTNEPCIGTRDMYTTTTKEQKQEEHYGEYRWATYSAVDERSKNFGSGIVNLGAKAGDRIGIFSKNRAEWLITQQGCYSQSLCIVSFYETLGKDSIRHVAKHSEIKIAVASLDTLETLLQVVGFGDEGYKGLRKIIIMDKIKEEHILKAESAGVKLLYFQDVEADGAENPVDIKRPLPADLATIMYTSGTTGMPKGVPLTHGNMVAMMAGIGTAVKVQQEVYCSYLPFAHIFERIIVSACLHYGAKVGFFHGDTQALLDDVKLLRPTVFCGVPRVYDKVKQGVTKKLEDKPLPLRLLFKTVYNTKRLILKYAPSYFGWIPGVDDLVFGEIKKALGGRAWLLISAGAPLSEESEIFLRIVFGCAVCQAYGLTETAGASNIKLPDDPTIGHMGTPLACNELKLVDLPDMGYTNTKGELCIRGPNVTAGYYKDAEKTREAIDKDGWFHTGDIAEFTPNGSLRIIDRKKNMFKLAQGEYVASEKVEAILTDNIDFIQQIFVYGDSQKNNLVAIIVPKKDKLLQAIGGSGDLAEVVAKKENREKVEKIIKDKARSSGLHGFETPTAVYILEDEEGFTMENDMLTPTMKPKRNVIQKNFQKQIDALYDEKDPYKVGDSKRGQSAR